MVGSRTRSLKKVKEKGWDKKRRKMKKQEAMTKIAIIWTSEVEPFGCI